MNDWLLWARFLFLNGLGFAGLALLGINGHLTSVIENDTSHISVAIFFMFLIGLMLTAVRVHRLSKEINFVKAGTVGRIKEYSMLVEHKDEESARQAMEVKLFAKIQWIRRIATSLVSLGLIGTVYGSIVFMLGVDLSAIGDIERVGEVFTVVMNGMGIALYTTLVGAVLNMWLSFNYGIVEHGTAYLLAGLIGHIGEE